MKVNIKNKNNKNKANVVAVITTILLICVNVNNTQASLHEEDIENYNMKQITKTEENYKPANTSSDLRKREQEEMLKDIEFKKQHGLEYEEDTSTGPAESRVILKSYKDEDYNSYSQQQTNTTNKPITEDNESKSDIKIISEEDTNMIVRYIFLFGLSLLLILIITIIYIKIKKDNNDKIEDNDNNYNNEEKIIDIFEDTHL